MNKVKILVLAIISTFVLFLGIYILIILLTLGSSFITGIYLSIETIKLALAGFLISILLLMYNFKIKKNTIIVITVVGNLLIAVIQELFFNTNSPTKIGESIVTYHAKVESSIFDEGEMLLIVLISLILINIFYWIKNATGTTKTD